MEAIRVSKDVLEGLEAVRRSGLTNMLDRPAVARLAEETGFADAAEWVKMYPKEYARGVFSGFETL